MRRAPTLALLSLLLVIGGAVPAEAATGQLDTSFNGDGQALLRISNFGDDRAAALAVQPDGRVVLAGQAKLDTGDHDFGLLRVKPDGYPDLTFGGGDGRVTTDVGDDFAEDVALQRDGKIVVVGGGQERGLVVLRYTARGRLDTTFSGNGVATFPTTNVDDTVEGVAIQPDGKILLATEGTGRAAVFRLKANGPLDRTFNGDGVKVLTFPGHSGGNSNAVTVDGAGRVVVACSIRSSADQDWGVARLKADGSFDRTFSDDGRAVVDFAPFDVPESIAIQANGRIVVGGFAGSIIGDIKFALARLNANGTPDSRFGGDGKVTTNLSPSFDVLSDLALQPDGKIVVAGTANRSVADEPVVVRYRPNGRLDLTFNGTGKVVLDPTTEGDTLTGIGVRDARIFVGGSAGESLRQFYAARLFG